MRREANVYIAFLCACVLMTVVAGCRLESAMDRFGDTLIESLDNSRDSLVLVLDETGPPEEIPCSDDLDVKMNPVFAPPAVYPERLRKQGVPGKATVLIIVDSAGAIISPRITYATDTAFARALLEAVKSWKIDPCKKDGIPTACYKKLTIDFELR